MQTDGTASVAGIKQGRHHAGIFAARIKQYAAARRQWVDLDFLARDHALGQAHARKGQRKASRNRR
jgi:hypothetical protein